MMSNMDWEGFSEAKEMEYISDFKYQNGTYQFKLKWKGAPKSESGWKTPDYFNDGDLESLKSFVKEYGKKYLRHCDKVLSRDDAGIDEILATFTSFGTPQFEFTSKYESDKNKKAATLEKQIKLMNKKLKPKHDFTFENEVDLEVLMLPKNFEWSNDYIPKNYKFMKTTKKDLKDNKSCYCEDNCIRVILDYRGFPKQPLIKCCFNKDNSYNLDGTVKTLDSNVLLCECDRYCHCDETKCQNRVVQKGGNCELCIFRTLDKGWGVKTLKRINKKAYISKFCGEVWRSDSGKHENKDMQAQYTLDVPHGKIEDKFLTIDATVTGNESRFFNHSCKPNMVILEVNTDKDYYFRTPAFFALDFIKAGEELTYKYATPQEDTSHLTLCKCGKCGPGKRFYV